MNEVLSRSAVPGGHEAAEGRAQRETLTHLLEGLRTALDSVATARRGAVRRRRGLLQRRLLLGMELLCKLEEQVLLPALGNAIAEGAPPRGATDHTHTLATVRREIDLLRDLSMLVTRTAAANRDTVVGVLEGMADLHAQRVDSLVAGVPAAAVAWGALEREMRGLLGRWRDEVLHDGDIEDEDQDPVGMPPR